MKLFTNTLLFITVIAVSACVSEEGAREHAEKGNTTAAKIGVTPGMMWKAIVYSTDAEINEELGYFESRSECHLATQDKQSQEKDIIAACAMVSSEK